MNKTMLSLMAALVLMSCGRTEVCKVVKQITEQYTYMLKSTHKADANPRTVYKDGTTQWCAKKFDWTGGFFPGSCWLIYEMTNDPSWKTEGEYFQSLLRGQTGQQSHDLGFVFHCSYGNALRLTHNPEYLIPMIEAGNTLISRFSPVTGVIKSWNTDRGWQAKRGWEYPVIIDNMMNLELLFKLTELTGDQRYRDVAVAHANTTMKNHFREDGSSYHVVDYSAADGSIRCKQTAQGYTHESSWARGQAWGLYGYTFCYRFTKDKNYLTMAEKIAAYIMNAPEMPEDKIPYWDYKDPDIPNVPRDVSAASITASALIELSQYSENGESYKDYAYGILKSLRTPEYMAEPGTNNYFLLKHSTGSLPHNNEIDVPLNYADYYFLEALIRQYKLENHTSELYLDFLRDPQVAVLPDFSWAGYRFGEEAIPEAEGRVFNVADYGAVPDDEKEDFDAIEKTIRAAEAAGGGIVFFPAGKFLMNEMDGRRDGIMIKGENIILKGSGTGENGTQLFTRHFMLPKNPSKPWTVPPMFTFSRGAKQEQLAMLAADARRGDFEIVVTDAGAFKPGDFFTLKMQNPEANPEYLHGMETWNNWKVTNKEGVKIEEIHRVKTVEGNKVLLCEPLHINMKAAYGFNITSLSLSEGCGVEDIWFRGNFKELLCHHRDFVHDAGWNCLKMCKMQNGYARRLRFTDVTGGVAFSGSYACSVLDVYFDGNAGHTSVGSQHNYGLFVGCVEDATSAPGIWHGPGMSNSTSGNVIWRYKGQARSGPDPHASWSYWNLIDASTSRYIGNGGNVRLLPNHLEGLVYWNHKEIGFYENIDFWEPQIYKDSSVKQYVEYGKFVKLLHPILVGWHGEKCSTFVESSLGYNDSFGKSIIPESLYEAQLEHRLGYLPDWINEIKEKRGKHINK